MRSSGLSASHGLHDLLGGLPRDGFAAVRAVRRADGAVDHAQVVVDFRDRADRRARRARGGLLLDGDRRRKPLDRIDSGPLHLIEELPRVGRKRFDVAPLALGIQRVERERGFARAGKPGDHRQRVARDFQADVLQIVLPGAPDDDFLQAHGVETAPYREARCTLGRMRPV